MTNFLIRLFVRDYKNTASARVRERYGQFAGIMGIVSNFLLFLIKIIAGTVFHSIAVTADAVNNLSDSGSSLVTLVGFKLSGKPADAEHPYGHARIEYISGLIVSFIIVFLGIQLIRSSVAKILKPTPAEFSWVLAAALVLSILIKFWQALFYSRIGGLIKSTTIKATAVDSRNDVLATTAVLAAATISHFSGFNLDGYMGVVVALFILASGIKLVMETSDPLLGTAPKKELVQSIYTKIHSYDGILGIHDLTVHSYGPGRHFASVHCEVSASEDIMVSHDLIDNIERDFMEELGIHLVIHLDPIDIDDERTNALRAEVTALVRGISPMLDIHDFRVVWGVTHSNLIFDIEVPFGFELEDSQLKEIVTAKIRALDSSYNAIITIDHDYVPREQVGGDF
ncbi:MAG: cation diffusion facilitator family transporter [Eubacteriales bacterium]|nr:cation diffusion facilitator family transporter [Eubacteriales bacterium]